MFTLFDTDVSSVLMELALILFYCFYWNICSLVFVKSFRFLRGTGYNYCFVCFHPFHVVFFLTPVMMYIRRCHVARLILRPPFFLPLMLVDFVAHSYWYSLAVVCGLNSSGCPTMKHWYHVFVWHSVVSFVSSLFTSTLFD